jgi:hypothetical protein
MATHKLYCWRGRTAFSVPHPATDMASFREWVRDGAGHNLYLKVG